MNELVKKVADKVGINEDQARKAVDIVVGFLKEKLPGPLSSQLDSALGEGGPAGEGAKALGSKLGL